jgi:CBS domain containing-hemolysin-like protein
METTDIVLTLLAMFACLACEAFFSGSEIGIVSANQMRLRHAADKGSRGARLALEMLKKPEWLLSTTLVGTNIAVVTNTTLGTALMIGVFGEQASFLAVILVAPLIWVFGEIVPKSVFQQRADTITPVSIWGLKFFSILFSPILVIFAALTKLLSKIAGGHLGHGSPFTLREEIAVMLQMPAQEGDIQAAERGMIRRMFNFSETTVADVMVPLIDVLAVDRQCTAGEAVLIASEAAHVRLPIYDERVDRVVGLLDALDLLGLDPQTPIAEHMRPVRFVPASKTIKELLIEFRKEGEEFAVVVDEFGGAEGIVTIEDIMEEVVEELQDEYDTHEKPQQWLRKLGEREYLASARIELETLTEKLGLEFPEGKFVSIGGFLIDRTHDIPVPGTEVILGTVSFIIERSTPQTVEEVRIKW